MCNAWNHDDSCDCGFGPPYSWKIKKDPKKKWYEFAILETIAYKRSLKDLGLSDIQIDEEMKRYKNQGFPVSETTWRALSNEKKADWKTRFLNLFKPYSYEEMQHIDREIDIPIFRLHSPRTKTSKVTYSQATSVDEPDAWSIMIIGFGTGDSQVFHLENTNEFSSVAGACKLVRLPVKLRLTLLQVYRGNQFFNNILKVEPSPEHKNEIMNEGVKPLPDIACKIEKCSKIGKSEVFPLAEDLPNNLSRYTRTLSSESEQGFSAEVGAFNMKGICRATVRRKAAITLTFELPGGFDYRLFHVEEPDGIIWELGEKTLTSRTHLLKNT
jgi:hypothetical protein